MFKRDRVFNMNTNPIPTGKNTLCKEDVARGSFSQVRQFTAAALTHLEPCDKDLASLFARDLYHLGCDVETQKIRSIFREYSNQLLYKIYVTDLVVSEPHLLFTPEQVEFIRRAYQIFLNNSWMKEEAVKKDLCRSTFMDDKDITALELYILDLGHEIGKYARYRYKDIRAAASSTFGNILLREYNRYIERANLLISVIEKYGTVSRSPPGLLPERTKKCLKAVYLDSGSVLIRLDMVIAYLADYEKWYDY